MTRLIVPPDGGAEQAGMRTLQRVNVETPAGPQRSEMVESAETIPVYKFPQLSQKELGRLVNPESPPLGSQDVLLAPGGT